MRAELACAQVLSLLEQSCVGEYVRKLRESHSPPLVGQVLSECMGREAMLSSGERFIFHTALAVWNGNRQACIADLRSIDQGRRRELWEILEAWAFDGQ